MKTNPFDLSKRTMEFVSPAVGDELLPPGERGRGRPSKCRNCTTIQGFRLPDGWLYMIRAMIFRGVVPVKTEADFIRRAVLNSLLELQETNRLPELDTLAVRLAAADQGWKLYQASRMVRETVIHQKLMARELLKNGEISQVKAVLEGILMILLQAPPDVYTAGDSYMRAQAGAEWGVALGDAWKDSGQDELGVMWARVTRSHKREMEDEDEAGTAIRELMEDTQHLVAEE